jgi:hypothetical protein
LLVDVLRDPLCLASPTVGVGIERVFARFASVESFGERRAVVLAIGVGTKDPKPLADVWSSDIFSAEHAPFSIVPERGQVPENGSDVVPCAALQKGGAVLKENEPRPRFVDDSSGVWPHVALVFDASKERGLTPAPSPCRAEWLAGESGGEQIDPAPWSPVEVGLALDVDRWSPSCEQSSPDGATGAGEEVDGR